MTSFGISDMQAMQQQLRDKYGHKWGSLTPEKGKEQLLWMVCEVGEVIDIIKKNGGEKASTDASLRKDLVEELADVLMFYNDVLLCYGITADELAQAYQAKFQRNMNRW